MEAVINAGTFSCTRAGSFSGDLDVAVPPTCDVKKNRDNHIPANNSTVIAKESVVR
jgi:hypothetical protein